MCKSTPSSGCDQHGKNISRVPKKTSASGVGYVIDCCVDFFLQSDVGRSGSLGGEDILRDHHELAKEAPAQDQDGPVLGFVRSAEGNGGRREEKSIALDQLHAVSVSSQEDVQEEVDGNNDATIESPFVRAGLLLFNHKAVAPDITY